MSSQQQIGHLLRSARGIFDTGNTTARGIYDTGATNSPFAQVQPAGVLMLCAMPACLPALPWPYVSKVDDVTLLHTTR